MTNPYYSGIDADGNLKKFPRPVPWTPAAVAARADDIGTLTSLSETEISSADDSGNTPLVWASDSGSLGALVHILDRCAEGDRDGDAAINVRGYLGNTPLCRAARGGHAECVSALLARGDIDANIANDKKQFPLHFAAFKKHVEVVEVMLRSGKCDTFVEDRKGRTPAEDTSVEEIREMILMYRTKKG